MCPLWQCGYSALNWQEALLEIRSASSSLAGLVFKDPRLAQAAAKNHGRIEIYRTGAVRWTICCRENRSFVNGRREWNSIYVAAKRKWVRALRTKISDSQFAVGAARRYGHKIRFMQAGNVYFARDDELASLSAAAKRAGYQWIAR